MLGPWESRPESGVVSYESELGKQLLGKRVGETLQIGDELLLAVAHRAVAALPGLLTTRRCRARAQRRAPK